MISLFGLQLNLLNNLYLPLIIIAGPTSIGKSIFAINLSKKINGEIINADSMQVYSNLKILTARPSISDTKLVPHHLYGHVNGSNRYNVASWCNDAQKIINFNNSKKINSIIVGGTGMYIEKLLNGIANIPSIPEEVKKESEKILINNGIEELVRLVKEIDIKAFNKISKNDTNRLRRIWEVHRFTDKNMSHWLENKNNNYLINQNYIIYLFTPERKEIYNKVNKRFINMIETGAIEEVKKLKSLNLDNSLPIMRAHGVPEITKYLNKIIDLKECIEKGQQVTRNYVKRQLTWWRSSKLKIYENLERFPNEIDLNLIKLP